LITPLKLLLLNVVVVKYCVNYCNEIGCAFFC
jgi:hypothetical protein